MAALFPPPRSLQRPLLTGTLAVAVLWLRSPQPASADEQLAYPDIAVALGEGEAFEGVEPTAYDQAMPERDAAEEPFDETAEEIVPAPSAAGRNSAPRRREIFRPITDVTADATLPTGLLPEQVLEEPGRDEADEMPEVGDARLFAGWDGNPFEWSSTRLCHGPLYFEEVNLERYGYGCHPAVQPLVSGAHFFLTVPTLPYQMTVHPPRECIYTLGHYRPGSRVPWQRHRLPWDARAAAVQAGVTVGLVFLIP